MKGSQKLEKVFKFEKMFADLGKIHEFDKNEN